MLACLPKPQALKLKNAFRTEKMTIEKLYNMTTEQRRKFFDKYVGEEASKFVNLKFEKSMVSSQKDALSKWVKSSLRGDAPARKTMLDKINSLEKVIEGRDTDTIEDLVADKLGVSVTVEEVQKIKELAENVNKASEDINNDISIKFGNDKHNQGVVDYFAESKKLDDYIAELNPQPRTKIALSTIGRGNMLMSPKTIALNIESNTVVGGTEFLIRRMQAGRISGVNHKESVEYIKWVNKIFDESGKDITRMIDQTSGAFQGEKVASSAGPGVIRRIGRFYEDTIYKIGLGKPDMIASSFSFADSANLTSTAIAKKQGLTGEALKTKAKQIFQDSTSIGPLTTEGMIVREQAMKDAFEATYTNEGMLSTFVLKSLRKPLNKALPGLGELVIPFAKTPANVVEISMDYGGVGAVKALVKLAQFFRTGDASTLKSASRDALRTGVGIIFASLLVAWLDPEDYIGEYPTTSKEKALLSSKNATPNSIKIGRKYVSLDYLGPLGAPVVGLLRARKYGREKSYLGKAKEYTKGIIQQYLRVPGIREIKDITATLYKSIREPFSKDVDQMTNDMANDLIDNVPPRVLPAIITDFAKMTDKTQRKPNYDKPGTRLQAKIPFWEQGLPPRETGFGEVKKNEPWWSQLLFGARVKTAIDTQLMRELTRLDRSGELPAISNPEYSSTRFKALKEQIGNVEFTKAMSFYGDTLNKIMTKEINHDSYKKATDETKKNNLNKVKGSIMNITLKKYNYKDPNKKSTPSGRSIPTRSSTRSIPTR